jgi:uncharacterized protein
MDYGNGTKEHNLPMKNTTALIFVFLIIIAGGIFLFAKGGANQNINGNVVNNNVQKITLSMKNYNYYPNIIRVKAGQRVIVNLDESVVGCYRSFVIRDFGISRNLRTPQDTVEFTPTKKGTYTFSCVMGMGRGKIIVE